MKSISIYRNMFSKEKNKHITVLLRIIQVREKFQPNKEWRLFLEPKSTHIG